MLIDPQNNREGLPVTTLQCRASGTPLLSPSLQLSSHVAIFILLAPEYRQQTTRPKEAALLPDPALS